MFNDQEERTSVVGPIYIVSVNNDTAPTVRTSHENIQDNFVEFDVFEDEVLLPASDVGIIDHHYVPGNSLNSLVIIKILAYAGFVFVVLSAVFLITVVYKRRNLPKSV